MVLKSFVSKESVKILGYLEVTRGKERKLFLDAIFFGLERVYMAGSGTFANARTRTHIQKSMTSSKNQKIGKIRKSGKSENRENQKIGKIRKIDDVIKKSENR